MVFDEFYRAIGAPGSLMQFGTPEEIREETIKLKRELGKGGGYIFSSCKPIMEGVPAENAAALIEASVTDEQEA